MQSMNKSINQLINRCPASYNRIKLKGSVVPHVPCTQPYPYLHRAQMYIYLAPLIDRIHIIILHENNYTLYSIELVKGHTCISTLLRHLPHPRSDRRPLAYQKCSAAELFVNTSKEVRSLGAMSCNNLVAERST